MGGWVRENMNISLCTCDHGCLPCTPRRSLCDTASAIYIQIYAFTQGSNI